MRATETAPFSCGMAGWLEIPRIPHSPRPRRSAHLELIFFRIHETNHGSLYVRDPCCEPNGANHAAAFGDSRIDHSTTFYSGAVRHPKVAQSVARVRAGPGSRARGGRRAASRGTHSRRPVLPLSERCN